MKMRRTSRVWQSVAVMAMLMGVMMMGYWAHSEEPPPSCPGKAGGHDLRVKATVAVLTADGRPLEPKDGDRRPPELKPKDGNYKLAQDWCNGNGYLRIQVEATDTTATHTAHAATLSEDMGNVTKIDVAIGANPAEILKGDSGWALESAQGCYAVSKNSTTIRIVYWWRLDKLAGIASQSGNKVTRGITVQCSCASTPSHAPQIPLSFALTVKKK